MKKYIRNHKIGMLCMLLAAAPQNVVAIGFFEGPKEAKVPETNGRPEGTTGSGGTSGQPSLNVINAVKAGETASPAINQTKLNTAIGNIATAASKAYNALPNISGRLAEATGYNSQAGQRIQGPALENGVAPTQGGWNLTTAGKTLTDFQNNLSFKINENALNKVKEAGTSWSGLTGSTKLEGIDLGNGNMVVRENGKEGTEKIVSKNSKTVLQAASTSLSGVARTVTTGRALFNDSQITNNKLTKLTNNLSFEKNKEALNKLTEQGAPWSQVIGNSELEGNNLSFETNEEALNKVKEAGTPWSQVIGNPKLEGIDLGNGKMVVREKGNSNTTKIIFKNSKTLLQSTSTDPVDISTTSNANKVAAKQILKAQIDALRAQRAANSQGTSVPANIVTPTSPLENSPNQTAENGTGTSTPPSARPTTLPPASTPPAPYHIEVQQASTMRASDKRLKLSPTILERFNVERNKALSTEALSNTNTEQAAPTTGDTTAPTSSEEIPAYLANSVFGKIAASQKSNPLTADTPAVQEKSTPQNPSNPAWKPAPPTTPYPGSKSTLQAA